MNLDPRLQLILVIGLAAIAIVAVVVVLLLPKYSVPTARLKNLESGGSGSAAASQSGAVKQSRRKQVQEALKQIADKESRGNKRLTIRALINQSGLDLSIEKFWAISAATGAGTAAITYLVGIPWYFCVFCGFVGAFGLPRWFLGFVRSRRLEKFLTDLPDAIDVMVRGIRSGLPLSDAMKTIAQESGPPVGPEFLEVVEGQRAGLTIEQGIERMTDRVPLQEVSFLSIVMNIQSKTGGNLSETLSNLSKVLRDRRRMKMKIKSASQEAKSSAAIIGSLPFFIVGILTFLSPDYLTPLFVTLPGNIILIGCGVWMLLGILVMWKMINFEV